MASLIDKRLEEITKVLISFDTENDAKQKASGLSHFLSKITSEVKSPYPLITNYVFDNEIIDAEANIASINLVREVYLEIHGEENDYVDQYFDSVIKHLKLAVIQYNHISNQMDILKTENTQLQVKLKEQEESFQKLETSSKTILSQIKSVKLDKSSIYTDFIAILGIFSALIFGLFGGFSTFSNWLQTIALNVSITRLTFMSSILMIGLLTLIFLLLNGIAILSDRTFKSCCKDDSCTHPLSQKYPLYFYGICILIGLALLSVIGMFWNYDHLLYDHPLISSIGVILFGISIVFVYLKLTKDKKAPD